MSSSKVKQYENSCTQGKRHASVKSHVVSKHEGMSDVSWSIMQEAFRMNQSEEDEAIAICHCNTVNKVMRTALPAFLDAKLLESVVNKDSADISEIPGRLGPENVVFDINGNFGTLVIETDRLGVTSQSNFSTIRANSCVFKGKWVYELMLGSKGVMQVGWCTSTCNFSQEEGVGDTPNSYAYDGNRLRKWNVRTTKYGEPWLIGDVISCALDCDNGIATFYRNGSSLGKAFTNIKLGPGFAYFPAVSLSQSENLCANFGATPLKYPIEGYEPLQEAPSYKLSKAELLFEYLDRILPYLFEYDEMCSSIEDIFAEGIGISHNYRSVKASIMLMIAHIFDKLAPLLRNAYIVEACLFQYLLKHVDAQNIDQEQPYISKILFLLWAFMQEHELKSCLEHLITSLHAAYRFAPVLPDFPHQHRYLSLMLAILKHEATRKFLLKVILFEKIKFPVFMHVKPPDDNGLITLIPQVWWPPNMESSDSADEVQTDTDRNMNCYFSDCEKLHKQVAELEEIQIKILLELLNNKDHKSGLSTRTIFLQKFRDFLGENVSAGGRGQFVINCPLPVSLCFMHRLIKATRIIWDEYHASNPERSVPSSEAYVPCCKFYDDSLEYFDIQRFGGLYSHLKKTKKVELQSALSGSSEHKGPLDSLLQKFSIGGDSPTKSCSSVDGEILTHDMVCPPSLIQLLDGIILLYNLASHKQLGKMCSLRDSLNDYVKALEDTDKKLALCPLELTNVIDELENAKAVFIEKISEHSRYMAWVIAVIYEKDKQSDVCWLLNSVLKTIELSSKNDNKFFSFVPDFYCEVAINTYNALRTYFHPTTSYDLIPDFNNILIRFAQFLSDHFVDSRIVNTDIRDSLVQSLACFVCYRISLQALENIAPDSRLNMIKALLSPYENRSWAQTNWILVRLWKGCGFGFRYKHLPHLLLPNKNQPQELGNACMQKPCPSFLYQEEIAVYLKQDIDAATKLVDSLLNQLNWAFSEFIGMLQELQQLSVHPMASIVDTRQLKICATCFDISVGLLRVLEMLINLCPEIFTDYSRPTAEFLMSRLFQLLSQVLNRVTLKSNMFDMVVAVNVPGLETVDHFPILTAVTGIIVRLLLVGSKQSKECAMTALLTEPGFQLSALESMLNPPAPEGAITDKKDFSLISYCEVNEREIEMVREVMNELKLRENEIRLSTPDVDEDSLCSICYARPKTTYFSPCNHESCLACISHHMMNKKECFFCKSEIKTVNDKNTGKVIKVSSS